MSSKSNSINRFEFERLNQIRTSLQVQGSAYVVPLYLAFSLLDYIYYPQFFGDFFLYRFAACFGFVLTKKLLNFVPNRFIELFSFIWLISVAALPIILMLKKIGDPGSPYYAGLTLVIVGATHSLRLKIETSILSGLVTIAFYAIGVLSFLPPIESHFFLNLAFLISSLFIAHVAKYQLEQLHLEAFNLRLQLEDELDNREQVIQKKSEEAIRLGLLSRQFSPQILEKIQAGDIGLEQAPEVKTIAVAFVDIVGSTDKINQLNPDQFRKSIELFYKTVTMVFLRFDITIDKFLGDGVVAFSNAPTAQSDFCSRILMAVHELRHQIEINRSLFIQTWEEPLSLRAGVAHGTVHVGFYGTGDLKTFTALGSAVNLAARLAQHAENNQILVAQDTAVCAEKDAVNLQFKFGPEAQYRLKGFQANRSVAVELETLIDTSDHSILDESAECPKGHGAMYLALNEKGHYTFKCRTCDREKRENTTITQIHVLTEKAKRAA